MAKITIEPNDEYTRYRKRWLRVRDVLDGEARLKERDINSSYNGYSNTNLSERVNYLRPINPTDLSQYNRNRNINYINGARFYNATVRTLSGLIGMLFRVAPTKPELPANVEYILSNVNGAGVEIDQQAQGFARDVVSIGRNGLLVDMPRGNGGEVTAGDVEQGFRATIQEYKAESIVDWHESVISGQLKLDLLVLHEEIERFKDEMMIAREAVDQYKVYRLSEAGVTVQVFTDGEDGLEQEDQIEVLGAGQTRLTEIPFIFVGSVNNRPNIDNLPLEPISNINLGHYQESANIASTSFQLSAAQPWVADDQYQRALRDESSTTVDMGEESMIVMGTGGAFGFASPPENNIVKSLMDDYKEQMITLGAQLITSGSGNETAEAARIRHASDVSILDVIAGNISDAYSKCLEWVGLFMGVDLTGVRYELNRNFFESKLSAQDLQQIVALWQAGGIDKTAFDKIMVEYKVISADTDLEEMNENIKAESGMPDLGEVSDGEDITGAD